MDFKSLLSQLDQLNEAEGTTVHKGTYGTSYGKEDVRDQYGQRIGKVDKGAEAKKDAPKKGRGRPTKATQTSGEDKKYDFSAFGVTKGKDVKLPKYDKKKTTKHSIKEYIDQLESALNEADQVTIAPAQSNTQVIKQGNKTLGTVTNPQLAAQIKQSIGKGEMSLAGDELGEGDIGKHNNATTGFDALVKKLTPKYGVEAAKRIAGAQLKKIREADQPPRDALASPLTMESRTKADNKAEKAGKKVTKDIEYDEGHKAKDDNKAEKAGKKVTKDIEYDEKKKLPSMAHIKKMCQDGKTVAEICKMHPDCDRAELKQMVADCKKTLDEASMPMKKVNGKSVPAFAADGKGKNDLMKKKVKEGMEHKLKAAYHNGKAHGLTGQAHCGKNYEDMEEARQYHEGYKHGLDECYGQMPIQGYVGEADSEVADMASYGAHTPTMEDDMYEMDKTSYMKQQAIKTPGDTFKAFGQTFKDKEVLESPFAFESWDKQLTALLEGKVEEGMTVSISKGQQGAPDSVSVSAQDGEADQLLSVIKSAGLGLFGGDDSSGMAHTGSMTVDNGGDPAEVGAGGDAIEVVGDHDGMMSLMKKLSGIGGEESAHSHDEESEESCNECGMAYESCGCDHGDKKMVDEVESEDQMTYQMAEDNPPDSGAAEVDAEDADTAAANAAAAAYDPSQDVDESESTEDEEQKDGLDLEESLANGADDTFETDIDFMTNTITGGLNKKKVDVAGNGQSTIPVTATRPMKESTDLLYDWVKLSGIR